MDTFKPKFSDFLSEEIYDLTQDWTVADWRDFRNNFCEEYYEKRVSMQERNFKEWKIKQIKAYKLTLNNI